MHIHHTLVLESCVVEVEVPERAEGCETRFKEAIKAPEAAAPSPAPPFERAAVLGVVVQLRHALLEQVSDLALLQKGQRQLILGCDKSLIRGRNTKYNKREISEGTERPRDASQEADFWRLRIKVVKFPFQQSPPRLSPFTSGTLT